MTMKIKPGSKKIESYHSSKSSAQHESKLRNLPILEIKQTKKKTMYVITTAPKAIINEWKKQKAKVKLLDSRKARKKKNSLNLFSW